MTTHENIKDMDMDMDMNMNMDMEKRMAFFAKYLDNTGMDHKPYQFEGVRWCLKNELYGHNNNNNNTMTEEAVSGIRGGFIADEMGLGKTITMIGVMLCNFLRHTLIIVPPILVDQWIAQIYKTTGHAALVYHGTANKKKITLEMLKNAPVVIASYGALVVRKKGEGEREGEGQEVVGSGSLLHQVEWSRIVYDEAHHLRNSRTAVFRGAKTLKTSITWLVSGTPIQNNLKDFYSLCSILGLPASFYTDKSNIPAFISSFVLRRTKKEVGIDMAELSCNVDTIGWSNVKEMEFAERIHDSIDGAGKYKLIMMLLAKQTCIMNKLLVKHLPKLIQAGCCNKEDHPSTIEACASKSKIEHVVRTILERKDNGAGKLVFCHFRQEIDEIAMCLRNGGVENVRIFDGRITGAKKRRELIEQKADVLILQIQTGCEGLNLQENYSEIYFVSPHWNPAVEEQAIARCHRIGQKKPVFIRRFIMGSFVQEEEPEPEREREQEHDKKQEQEPEQEQDDEQEEPEQEQEREQEQEQEIMSMDNYIMNVQERKKKLMSFD
jgi:SNF2 family DNA or RNA helicase